MALLGASAGCRTGGVLAAVPATGRDKPAGPGSGFVGRFEAADGMVSGVTVEDYGEGYTDAGAWRVVPAAGGEGCVAGAFRAWLVAAGPGAYPPLLPQAEPLP